MTGEKLNGFTIKSLISEEGGMAKVYLAENGIGKKAAVKVLLPKFFWDEPVKQRFINEAKTMVKLEHEHICSVYDLVLNDRYAAIILEYMEGNDLSILLDKHQSFSEEKVRDYLKQVCAALDFAHKNEVVHRDIKPSNLFLHNGKIKLMDFGIAQVKSEAGGRMTKTGTRMGSVNYMSPEQIRSTKDVDFRTDIYSLGITAYQMLTGKLPYTLGNDDTEFAIMEKIIRETPKPIDGVSQQMNSFIQKATAKNPEDRFSSMAEALQELDSRAEQKNSNNKGETRKSTDAKHVQNSGINIEQTSIFDSANDVTVLYSSKLNGKSWNYMHPDRMAKTLCLVSNDTIAIGRTLINNIDVDKLVNVDFIVPETVVVKKGIRYFSFGYCTFLVHEKYDILLKWLNVTALDEDDDIDELERELLRMICNRESTSSIKIKYQNWISHLEFYNINAAIIPIVVFNNHDLANKALERMELTVDYITVGIIEACQIKGILLDNMDAVKEDLNFIESSTIIDIHLYFLVQATLQFFNDYSKAAYYIEHATDLVNEIDYDVLAKMWLLLFNNVEDALKSFRKATKQNTCMSDWRDSCEIMYGLFDDKQAAYTYLDEAERKVEDTVDLTYCAEAWMEIFNDKDRAINLLDKAERKTEDTVDLTYCAEAWMEIFNDKDRAINLLDKAERKAEYPFHLTYCAEAWMKIFNDKDRAINLLEKAERKAEDTSDLTTCAKAWMEIFNDKDRAINLLEKAERKADGSYDLTICVKAWMKIFNDKDRAINLLDKTERKAEDPFHLTYCAEAWMEIFNDKDRAINLLEKAERKAIDTSDLTTCAKAWMKIFNDKDRAINLLEKAERKAEDTFDLTTCAEAWMKIFNDKDRAINLLDKTERKEDGTIDLTNCAEDGDI